MQATPRYDHMVRRFAHSFPGRYQRFLREPGCSKYHPRIWRYRNAPDALQERVRKLYREADLEGVLNLSKVTRELSRVIKDRAFVQSIRLDKKEQGAFRDCQPAASYVHDGYVWVRFLVRFRNQVFFHAVKLAEDDLVQPLAD